MLSWSHIDIIFVGRILVSGAGNEGNTDIHYSGNIQMTDKSSIYNKSHKIMLTQIRING